MTHQDYALLALGTVHSSQNPSTSVSPSLAAKENPPY